MKLVAFISLMLMLISCAPKNNTLFSEMPSTTTHVDFKNSITNQNDMNIFSYRNFYNGGGVAIGDINNDNLNDIYFTSNQNANKLYLNKGNFQFEDISKTSKIEGTKSWSTGVVMVDINNDGWLDIYVCNAGNYNGENRKNELFINNGDLTFTEEAEKYGLDIDDTSTHAAFFDFDKDGDLDVYILNNSFIPVNSLNYSNRRDLRAANWKVNEVLKGGGDKFLINNEGLFEDVSEKVGIYGSLIGFGLGVTIGDVNNDGWSDIYISNDFYEHDYLYLNNQIGGFVESSAQWFDHNSMSSMGADMQDINNDGLNDLFVTDMLPENDTRLKETTTFETYDVYKLKQRAGFNPQYMQNTLHLNNGTGFNEIANISGVSKTDWSWGALIFDMDNDGFKDLFVCNGIINDLTNQDFIEYFADTVIQEMVVYGKKEEKKDIINKMPSTPIKNYAFKNKGELAFENRTDEWGFDIPSFSNGAAYGDLDNDGDLDLVINNNNQKSQLFKNNSELLDNNYIKINLSGQAKNTSGIGTVIKLFTDNQIVSQEMNPSRGFQSSVSHELVFGLGKISTIDSIEILWPNFKKEILYQVSANQTLTIQYNDNLNDTKFEKKIHKPILNEVNGLINYSHTEDNFIDFNYEGLLIKSTSMEGPAMAVGDVNNDGLDDLFLGGAKDQEAQIYIQNNYRFSKVKQPLIAEDILYEDTAAHFTDTDNDGDLDLIVSSGGNFYQQPSLFANRLYLNDGLGNFNEKIDLPTTHENSSSVSSTDIDGDGDRDILITSRSIPSLYGILPKHLLLENKGNNSFVNSTQSLAYDIKNAGMITDAQWFDIDSDGDQDLLAVGDWTTFQIYINKEGVLKLHDHNLTNSFGWWSSIFITDINNDGLFDILLGNNGLNSTYKSDPTHPIRMYINDFDKNGTIEQITTQKYDNKFKPINLKKDITKQLSYLKKISIKNKDYSNFGIRDLFSKSELENSLKLDYNESRSLLLINKGNLNFDIKPLPFEAQISTINSFELLEKNDTKTSILFAGNNFSFVPQFGRLDALKGGILEISKTGEMKVIPSDTSGVYVKGVTKHIKKINTEDDSSLFMFLRNNEAPLFYRINNE